MQARNGILEQGVFLFLGWKKQLSSNFSPKAKEATFDMRCLTENSTERDRENNRGMFFKGSVSFS